MLGVKEVQRPCSICIRLVVLVGLGPSTHSWLAQPLWPPCRSRPWPWWHSFARACPLHAPALVQAASDIISPVSGEIVEANTELANDSSKVRRGCGRAHAPASAPRL